MKTIYLGPERLEASQLILGCMRISEKSLSHVEKLLQTSLDQGINFFDHADIYGQGESEKLFGQAIKNMKIPRESLVIQSKGGIREGFYDFSKAHLKETIERSLERLQVDYLDYFLLHRPDALVEPEEVAELFDELYHEGKVRHFGVSNQNQNQIELLKKYVKQPLEVNQLQYGVQHSQLVSTGMLTNYASPSLDNQAGGLLDYLRLNDITVQAWSPLQYGYFEGVFLDHEKFPKLNALLSELALKYGVTPSAIAIAWISRHPAKMQTILGSTSPERLIEMAASCQVNLTREEWYAIYQADGQVLL